jgi:hypothetical protein
MQNKVGKLKVTEIRWICWLCQKTRRECSLGFAWSIEYGCESRIRINGY